MKRPRRIFTRTAMAWGLIATCFLSAFGRQARAQAPPPETPLTWLTGQDLDGLPRTDQAIGPDPRAWRVLVSAGAALRHVEAFRGVDAVLRGDASRLEALLTLGGGVDPAIVELQLAGATAVEMSGQGHAIVRTPAGDVVLLRPGMHVESDEGRRALPAGWRDAGEGRIVLDAPTVKEPVSAGFHVLFLPEALATLDRNQDGRVGLDELAPVPPAVLGGPTVDATKRDTLVVDNDLDNQADPGDTLEYDVRIDNLGGSVAGSVTFADPLDPNLTLVPGSINVSPLALDDTYQAIGHVTLNVTNPTLGIFANDSEFLGGTFALTSPAPGVPTPTTGGGTVTVAADGTFGYAPPVGFAGPTDSFSYTITDAGGLTGTASVTFTIAGLVWFIDRDAAPGGTGTQASPFDAIADVNGAGGAGDPDAPNHVIYLHDRAAPVDYVLGLELEPGQQLVGSGVPLVVGATTVLPATTPPTVEHAGGNAITLASGATVSGLDVIAANNAALFGTGALGATSVSNVAVTTSGSGAGLSLLNHSGTVTLSGTIAGSGSGAAALVDGGGGGVDLSAAPISKTAGRIVHVRNRTGGTVTFGGVSGTASVDAVALETNAAGAVTTFTAGLNLTTTNARALFANNGGTVNLAGASSVLNATGAAAIDATGTTFGGGGSFATVSSTNSTAEGVRLANVTGTLTMSGGAITGSTGTAFSLAQGSSAMTYGGSISKTNAGRAVDVTARAGGTATFSGPVTAAGASTGINVSGATAASTVQFSGSVDLGTAAARLTGGTALTVNHQGTGSTTSFTDLDVFTTGQQGINASNGGTLDVTAGQVDAGGRALNLDGLALGVTLTQVISSGSPSEGARLNSASGTLSIASTTVTNPSTQGVLVLGTSASANFGTTSVAGGGTQRILVSTTTGNVTFGATTVSGGTDGVSLQNNGAGTRTFSGTLSVSGNSGIGFLHAAGGGATTVAGLTTVTNPGGTGVEVQSSASSVTFNGVTVNKGATAGTGINLVSNTVGPSFGALNVTASNGTGVSISTSPITTAGGTVAATNGPAISASGAAFSGNLASASSTNSASQGISLTNASGTYSIAAGSITGAAGTAFLVSGGNATFGYAGSVTQNGAQRSVDVQTTTGGGITIGTVTGGASSTGVNINAANGGVTFTSLTHGSSGSRTANQAVTVTGGTGTYNLGTVSLFTTGGTGRGIVALNADGTLTSAAGTVNASGAAAIDIDGPAGLTTLGMTLTSVGANGGVNGMVIRDTNGTFVVVGDGTNNASGGTITGTSGDGVLLTNARGFSFGSMLIQNITAGSGIRGTQVVDFTFQNGTVSNVGSEAAGSTDSAIAFKDSVSFTENNLSGVVSVTGSTFTEPGTSALNFTNWAGTISNLTVTGNTFSNATSVAGGDAVHVFSQGSAATSAHITTGTLTNNVVSEWYVGTGINVQGGNTGSAASVTLGAAGTPIAITGNRFRNATTSTFGNAIAVGFNGQNGVSNFVITNNGTAADPLRRFGGLGVSAFFGGNVTGGAQVDGQFLTSFNTAGSAGVAVQADAGLAVTDAAVVSATLNDNNVSNNDGNGVRGIVRASAATLRLKAQNNVVTAPLVANRNGVRVDSGSAAGDTTLCLNMSGNTSAGSGVNQGLGVRKQGTVAGTNEFGIHNLSPSPANPAQTVTFLNAANPAGGGTDVISGDNYLSCSLP